MNYLERLKVERGALLIRLSRTSESDMPNLYRRMSKKVDQLTLKIRLTGG